MSWQVRFFDLPVQDENVEDTNDEQKIENSIFFAMDGKGETAEKKRSKRWKLLDATEVISNGIVSRLGARVGRFVSKN